MDQHQKIREAKQSRFSLSQETITILTVGLALAGIILVNQGEMRAEARADRAEARATLEAMGAEARADRARIEVSMNQMRAEELAARKEMRAEGQAARKEIRAEGQAARKEMRAEGRAYREAFAKQIAEILERQGSLNGLVEGLRNPIRTPEG